LSCNDAWLIPPEASAVEWGTMPPQLAFSW
jgi:hypothetical protein